MIHVLDLDGVVRAFDSSVVIEAVDERLGLHPGTFIAVALAQPFLGDATSGRTDHATWSSGIRERLQALIAGDIGHVSEERAADATAADVGRVSDGKAPGPTAADAESLSGPSVADAIVASAENVPDQSPSCAAANKTANTQIDAEGRRAEADASLDQWLAFHGTVDHDVISVVRDLRAGGSEVFILTNGTSRVPLELERIGITSEFTDVINTYDLGSSKPDEEAFAKAHARIEATIGRDAVRGEVRFTDDLEQNVAAARRFGWDGCVFSGADDLRRRWLRESGPAHRET